MVVSCVACGESGRDWHKIPCDLSIGCNDAYKFGVHPDWLILVNAPRKFHKRLEIIKQTQAKRVLVSSMKEWTRYFPKAERLTRLVEYHTRTRVRIGAHYTAQTSPIICVSLALEAGATVIVLWGVDFTNHHRYYSGSKDGDRQVSLYLDFFKKIQAMGIAVYLGAPGSVFDSYLSVYKPYDFLRNNNA